MARQPKSQETERRMTPEMRRKAALMRADMTYDAYRRIAVERVLQMPVLLYWGKNDPAADQFEAESLFNIIADTNPRVRLYVTNAAGHFPYREQPEEFAHTVISFADYWNGPGAEELTTARP
jgi:pimeloyl-ACP methyl ester carboxylesterase